MARSSTGERTASVRTNPSVVAICGWIIPEPLVMPATRTAPRRNAVSAKAVLGTRSVVMMARAASSKRPGWRPAARRGSASIILCGSISTPITPVETGSTWLTGSRNNRAAALQVASATAWPVRVAPFGWPGFPRNCAPQPMREPQMAPAKLDRRGLHAVLREDGGGGGGKAADNQREIVLLHLAYAGIGGGIEIAKRHLQERYPPRTSLSANRWPFAKSAAGSRLRPSICTSSNRS